MENKKDIQMHYERTKHKKMQKLPGLLFIISIFLAGIYSANGQTDRVKALFIYNFTKYIEWPDAAKQGPFIITVLGEASLFDQLVINTSTRKVSTQQIVVKRYDNIADVEKCHILFISQSKSDNLKEALNLVKNWYTLVITEAHGLINSGAGLNLINKDGKQTFEINTEYLEAKKLVYNSTLIQLGIKVK